MLFETKARFYYNTNLDNSRVRLYFTTHVFIYL